MWPYTAEEFDYLAGSPLPPAFRSAAMTPSPDAPRSIDDDESMARRANRRGGA